MENSEVIVKVEAPSFGKDFIGRVVQSSDESILGKKVFLPYVLPDELVTVKIIEEKKNFLRGELISILEKSKFRVVPKCPFFYKCGGCHYQYIDYNYQLELKKKIVSDYLKFQSKIQVGDITIIGENKVSEFNYRKRAVFHISENGMIGFFEGGSRDVIDIDSCDIISLNLNYFFKEIKNKVSALSKYFYSLILDSFNDDIFMVLKIRNEEILKQFKQNDFKELDTFVKYNLILEFNDKPVYKNFSQNEFAGHFSQVNIEANKFLTNFVLDNVTKMNVTELYAGAGNFSFPLTKKCKNILAVELDKRLVEAGVYEAKKNKLEEQVKFVQSSCEKFVKKNKLSECVILDPPRSGAKEVVKHIDPNDTKEIIYISCSLPSFQRDLKELVLKGYKIEKLSILDMFPQTYHVEIVVLMSRVEGK